MRFIDVDLVIIFMVYLLLFDKDTGAVIFAFGQGLLTDIFSSGLLGFSTLIYLVVFFCIKLGSYPIALLSVRGQIIILSLAVFIKELLFLALLYLFSFKVAFSSTAFLALVTSAVCSGIIGPFFYYLLHSLTHLFPGTTNEAQVNVLDQT